MRIGLAIGPLKFWIQIGTPRRRHAPRKGEQEAEPRRTTSKINGAVAPALVSTPEISPLLEKARADAVGALVTLGYKVRIARERVNAVPITDASTTEEILRGALRGDHVSTN
jgi:RuvA, C-terminal domain